MYLMLQISLDLSMAEGHMCNMGRMIEDMESKLRNSLEQVLSPLSFFETLAEAALSRLSLSINSYLYCFCIYYLQSYRIFVYWIPEIGRCST
jgi:hypothetical protein